MTEYGLSPLKINEFHGFTCLPISHFVIAIAVSDAKSVSLAYAKFSSNTRGCLTTFDVLPSITQIYKSTSRSRKSTEEHKDLLLCPGLVDFDHHQVER